MSRTIEINPVTRIEGHAKVHVEISDDGKVDSAFMSVLEFRGFEKFVQGMQVELLPTLTTRICGTCPHAQHLVSAKCVDKVFGVEPPRAGTLLRELLNCGSMLHSHGIHFFAMAGPDLLLGVNSPAEKRNIIGLLEHSPELAKKALRLRSIGQKISEIVGGRGVHPVTAVAGGMAASISKDTRETLRLLAAEGLELSKLALAAGKEALEKNVALLDALPLSVTNIGTVKNGNLDLYDGQLRARRPDASIALEFPDDKYRDHLYEEALPFSYGKQVLFRDPQASAVPYRVGPLARINAADQIDTPLANDELAQFKSRFGNPCDQTVLYHYARLIEMLYCAELAVRILNDDEIISPNVRTPITSTPHSAIAHVEAPRGVLIHDYKVDKNGIVEAANFLVATQHNLSSINSSIKSAATHFWGKPDSELLNGIEFAIRCYDPCLSCSTHQIGSMPLDVTIARQGQIVRSARR